MHCVFVYLHQDKKRLCTHIIEAHQCTHASCDAAVQAAADAEFAAQLAMRAKRASGHASHA